MMSFEEILIKQEISDESEEIHNSIKQEEMLEETNLDVHVSFHHQQYSCTLCTKIFNTQYSLKRHKYHMHIDQLDVKDGKKCDVCNKLFFFEYSFKCHLKTHTNEETHPCWFCNKKFKTGHALRYHCYEKHGPSETADVNQKNFVFDSMREQFNCKFCEFTFDTEDALIVHVKRHEKEGQYKCSKCNLSFNDKATLTEHVNLHHKCAFCGKKFSQKSALKVHIRRIHLKNEKQLKINYRCDICNKPFVFKSHLERHVFTHTNERPVQCELCKKTFKDNKSLKVHTIRSHTEYTEKRKQYQCEICKKSFLFKSHLRAHSGVHLNVTPFVCEICGTGFSNAGSRKNHMKNIHANKAAACTICGKEILHGEHSAVGAFLCDACGALNKGKKLCTSKKMYPCKFCTKIFKSEFALKRHKYHLHIDELDTNDGKQCSICKKTFFYDFDLKRHLTAHTKERCHPCEFCHKKFKTIYYLRFHCREIHGRKITSLKKIKAEITDQ